MAGDGGKAVAVEDGAGNESPATSGPPEGVQEGGEVSTLILDGPAADRDRIAEPVRVARIRETKQRAVRAWVDLRAELGGLNCETQAAVDTFVGQVALRLNVVDRDARDALLFMLAVENLAMPGGGVNVKPGLLRERLASRGEG